MEGLGEGLKTQKDGESQIRSLMENSPDIVCGLFDAMDEGFALHEIICDDKGVPVDYRFLAVNPAFESLTGLRAEDIVGRRVLEVLPNTEPSWIERYGVVALTGQSASFEDYSQSFDRYYGVKAFCPTPGHFACVFSDISESKKAAKSLLRERDNLLRILDAFPDGVYIIDAARNMRYANPALERLFGPVNGRKCHDYFRMSKEKCDRCTMEMIQRGETCTWEWHSDLNGRLYELFDAPVVDEDGKICKLAMLHDITNREEAAKKLGESEERFRLLFESAIEGIALADVETGALVEFNQAFLDLTGYRREDLLGASQQILHPSDPDFPHLSKSFIQHRDAPSGTILAVPMLTASGVTKIVEIKSNRLDLHGRQFLQGFFRDVTAEQKYHAERETTLTLLSLLNDEEHTHELMRMLTQTLQEWTGCEAVGVRIKDGDDYPYFETRGFSAEFVQAENYLCERDLNGQFSRDTAGNPVIECMCGNVICGRFDPSLPFFTEKGSFWSNCTTDLLASTTDEDRQTRTRNRCNGEGYESVALIPLRYGKESLGLLQFNDRRKNRFTPEILAFLEGLSDQIAVGLAQRQSEVALRISERNLAEAQRLAHLGHWIWQFSNGKVIWSDETYRIFGVSLPEYNVSQDSFIEFVHPGDRDLVTEAIRAALAAEKRYDVQLRIVRPDGSTRIVRSQGEVEYDARNAPVRMIGSVQDITERVKLEEQLAQSRKMEAIGQLAGGVAHDFNNLLQVISGYNDLAMAEIGMTGSAISFLQEVERAADRAKTLVSQLLLFSRRQPRQPRLLNISDLLRDTLKMIGRVLGEHIELSLNVKGNIKPVLADPHQLDQMVMNLCVNARDAMPNGGRVSLDVRTVIYDQGFVAAHDWARCGEFVELCCRDTGSGIPAELLDRIFEPFFSTKEVGKGTGLGLASVYGIVQEHGGLLNVESVVGKGSVFRVCLSVAEGASEPENVADKVNRSPQGHQELILLAEDEDPVRRLAAAVLEKAGYRVIAVTNGEEALDSFGERPAEYSMVILDVVMPKMGGRMAADGILKIRSEIPILYATGYDDDAGDVEHLKGNEALLRKPFRPAELLDQVRGLLLKCRTS